MTANSPVKTDHAPTIDQFQVILAVIFGVAITTANITAAKLAFFDLPFLGGVAVPAGFIAFGVAFLASDLIAETYGKDYAHTVVNATVIALGLSWALIYTAIHLPVAPFYEANEAYNAVLGSSGHIVVASIITILISQHIDVSIFHEIRSRTGVQHRWVRNLGSTSISQLVDTVIFIGFAFAIFPTLFSGDPVWGAALASLIVGQYIVKLGIAVIDTPIFYLITTVQNYRDTTTEPSTA